MIVTLKRLASRRKEDDKGVRFFRNKKASQTSIHLVKYRNFYQISISMVTSYRSRGLYQSDSIIVFLPYYLKRRREEKKFFINSPRVKFEIRVFQSIWRICIWNCEQNSWYYLSVFSKGYYPYSWPWQTGLYCQFHARRMQHKLFSSLRLWW